MKQKILDVDHLAKNFMQKCYALPKIKVAVIYPCSPDSLEGAIDAAEQGLIEPILIGPKAKIIKVADELSIDISAYELIDVPNSIAAAEKAVALAHEGAVSALMKGSLHTDEMMHEVIKRRRVANNSSD